MGRPSKFATQVFEVVCQHPGINPPAIARILQIPASTVYRALPATEKLPQLLYEDRGKLYPFRQKKDS